jgi:hypothetical protein
MATSVLKKITAEAKLLRKKNPKLKWTTAIKKASEFYKGTVKPVAKKTYKKAKAVAKAGAKGVAVARRSYARSMAGVELQKLPNRKKPFVFYDTKSELLWANEYFRTKSEADKFAKQNSIKYKDKTKTQVLKQLATNEYRKSKVGRVKKLISIPKAKIDKMTKAEVLKQLSKAEYEQVFTTATYNNLDKRLNKPARKSKVGAVKKIAFKRTGKGGSKLGSVKKVSKPEIKPLKPTFAILNNQNPAFLSSLIDNGTKPKSKILVYSPEKNRWLVIVQYAYKYVVYIISPSQRIVQSDLFMVVGTHKLTLDRINKRYDIDLVP